MRPPGASSSTAVGGEVTFGVESNTPRWHLLLHLGYGQHSLRGHGLDMRLESPLPLRPG